MTSGEFGDYAGIARHPALAEAVVDAQGRFPRVVQVAEAVDGTQLGTVLRDPALKSTIERESLSETFVLNLLTLAADAKGDNFMVDSDGQIVGIDNDHVFAPPYTDTGTRHRVNIRNILLCHTDLLDAAVAPNCASTLRTRSPLAETVGWLTGLRWYESEIERLKADGAIPAEYFDGTSERAKGIVARLPMGGVALLLDIWTKLQRVAVDALEAGSKLTHRALLRAVLPQVDDYYNGLAAECESAWFAPYRTIGDPAIDTLKWVYHQFSAVFKPDVNALFLDDVIGVPAARHPPFELPQLERRADGSSKISSATLAKESALVAALPPSMQHLQFVNDQSDHELQFRSACLKLLHEYPADSASYARVVKHLQNSTENFKELSHELERVALLQKIESREALGGVRYVANEVDSADRNTIAIADCLREAFTQLDPESCGDRGVAELVLLVVQKLGRYLTLQA